MLDSLPVPTAVLALLAAAVHVYIFLLESVLFTARGHRVFGIRAADVPTVRDWAYNQGFYNLFLALGALAGVLLALLGDQTTAAFGVGMTVLATGSMVAAAVVLVTDRPSMARAAAVQGSFPLLALAAWMIWG